MKYFFLAIILMLFSCSREKFESVIDALPAVQKAKTASKADFNGKSDAEILQMKYERISLKCDLWTQYGKELNLNAAPNDTTEIDFFDDPSLENSLISLAGNTSGRTLNIQLKVESFKIFENLEYHGPTGRWTSARYSPVFKLAIKFSADKSSGSFGGSGSGNEIFEKSATDLMNQSSHSDGDEFEYFDYLKCVLNTQAKEEYKDQFSVIRN